MSGRLEITSTKNPAIRRVRDAAAGDLPGELLADGLRVVWDVVRAELPIRLAAVSPRLFDHKSGHDLKRRLEQRADEFFECSEAVLAKMSSLETPQGVLVIAARPAHRVADLLAIPDALVVVAAGVRDPGNLGAICRTAEAAGATGLAVLAGSADPFRDKAVRGSSGSVFRLPTAGGVPTGELIDRARERGLQLVVADNSAERDYLDVDYRAPTVLALGGEGAGIPEELLDAATARVRIPMAEGVESLNVSVAAGVLLFEARRQRR
jgi:TrmH family RNA methyltransferase